MNDMNTEVIKGYLIAALRCAELDRDTIIKVVDGLDWANENISPEEALEFYKNFRK